jgi:hypothetical protein
MVVSLSSAQFVTSNITTNLTNERKKLIVKHSPACFQHDLLPHNITTVVTSRDRASAERQHHGLRCNITLQRYNGHKEKKAGGNH